MNQDDEMKAAILQQVKENLQRAFPVPDETDPRKLEELLWQLGEALRRPR